MSGRPTYNYITMGNLTGSHANTSSWPDTHPILDMMNGEHPKYMEWIASCDSVSSDVYFISLVYGVADPVLETNGIPLVMGADNKIILNVVGYDFWAVENLSTNTGTAGRISFSPLEDY